MKTAIRACALPPMGASISKTVYEITCTVLQSGVCLGSARLLGWWLQSMLSGKYFRCQLMPAPTRGARSNKLETRSWILRSTSSFSAELKKIEAVRENPPSQDPVLTPAGTTRRFNVSTGPLRKLNTPTAMWLPPTSNTRISLVYSSGKKRIASCRNWLALSIRKQGRQSPSSLFPKLKHSLRCGSIPL
jgi:hypothetical protein